METLTVELKQRSYPIYIGDGLLEGNAAEIIQNILADLGGRRVIIISDSNVGEIYANPLADSLKQLDISCDELTIPAGEGSKSFAEFENLLNDILALNPDRKTTLIALGGGVVGDITGFAASVILRGIPFIQIPTSLLAQVDSSVGGKTAINSKYGKNLIGAFYQPKAVIADISTLSTLPKRQILAGYAEILKYGLINDESFFRWLEENGEKVISGDADALKYAVKTSCAAKAEIVAEDERESGKRALLNLGHTFGHALEKATGYSDLLLHGEAVAIGCLMAFAMSVKAGLCPESDYDRLKSHLQKAGLSCTLSDINSTPNFWNIDELVSHCYQDKKTQDGKLNFILAKGIGKAFMQKNIDKADVKTVFSSFV